MLTFTCSKKYTNKKMRTILVADNQAITRIGMLKLLETEFGETDTILVSDRELLQNELRKKQDSVVILDYTLFDFETPDQMLNLKASVPQSSWLLFSDELSATFMRTVLAKDPDLSVVMKCDSLTELTEVLANTISGKSRICQHVHNLLIQSEESLQTEKKLLTPSEQNILRQIAAGKSTKEIAYEMNLSFHTVNTHRKNIFRKIEVNNVHEAIRYAIRAGIADLSEYYI